ncbi:succinate dehydrogenase subunit C [Candidatus Pantoea carbekii]|uniref:Succinate dehydrogenase cytochrome b556 subunit n=1 Tax=Candidatus Pantoea carbekii TaxID=1235990 RepID=U3U3I3_9GAMM|nr:succinate dehydrogenase subunit C [Candidatus Pantoea carbekii]BAO00726.1 succinate dehydrogenase cytochrome b556 large membrane subunit [Candidatus Pantoea carbekii]
MKKKRPVNLNLTTIRFPLTAISSILHRVSGVSIFFALGVLLWLLDLSLSSPKGFGQVACIIDRFFMKFILWSILTILAYHVISGFRYIMMDVGYLPETLIVGVRAAKVVFALTVLLSIFFGVIIW